MTLASAPRTSICLVLSGITLAVSVGLTVTVVGAVSEGVIVLEAARLKSSARFAIVPWFTTSGASLGNDRVMVIWVVFGAASGRLVAPSMMLFGEIVTPVVPLSTTRVAPL